MFGQYLQKVLAFSNVIRCASRFMMGMIFEMLIEMFDLIDFVDLNKLLR